jgi:serine/threonine-protein kinase RsbW
MDETTARTTIDATSEGVKELLDFAEDCGKRLGCPLAAVRHLLIICDEVCSNIVKYAYPDCATGSITIELEDISKTAPGRFVVRFIDKGIAFDPLAAAVPDLTVPLDSRPPGKLGITIVRNLACSAEYARIGEMNVLTVTLPR